MHGRYLLMLALFIFPLMGCTVLNYLYLRQTGEFLQIEEIVQRQQHDAGFCIYGTGLHGDTPAYKLEGYRERQPDVAVLGSSVSMQIRERYFTSTFYSLSSTMDSVVAGESMLTLMLREHKPKMLLLGIDFWWFPAQVQPYQRLLKDPNPALSRFTMDKLFRPFSWLTNGQVTVSHYFHGILRGRDNDLFCNIGTQALEKRRGFGPDGSYYYTSVIEGKDLTGVSPRFEDEQKDIALGLGHYVHDAEVNTQTVDNLLSLIRETEAAGTKVVVFFQPLAPEIYAEMQKHPEWYSYIPKLLQAFHDRDISYVDLRDPASIGADHCEFIDGDHAGDVAYARVIRAIYDATSDVHVRSLINIENVDSTIRDNTGLSMARDPRVTTSAETDFLGLGCTKQLKIQDMIF